MDRLNLPAGTLLQQGRYVLVSCLQKRREYLLYTGCQAEECSPVLVLEFCPVGTGSRRQGTQVEILPGQEQRWEQERQDFLDLGRLQKTAEPGVLPCVDVFEENRTAYLVLPREPGAFLDTYIEKHGAFSPIQLLTACEKMLKKLQNLHARGKLHGAICPEELYVGADGTLQLLRLGSIRPQCEAQEFGTGESPDYAPPEQFQTADLTAAADIFALSASLYLGMTGRCVPNVMQRALGESVELTTLAEPVGRLLQSGLELERQNRCQTVEQWSEQVRHCTKKLRKLDVHRRRARLLFGILFGAVLVVLGSIFGWNEYHRRNPKEIFELCADYRMTDQEVQEMEAALRDTLAPLRGSYGLQAADHCFRITIPQKALEGETVSSYAERELLPLAGDNPMELLTSPHVQWEGETEEKRYGDFQVERQKLPQDNVLLTFPRDKFEADQGEIALAKKDASLKKMLDTLEVPYSFGHLQEDPMTTVALVPPGQLSDVLLECLYGGRFVLTDTTLEQNIPISWRMFEDSDSKVFVEQSEHGDSLVIQLTDTVYEKELLELVGTGPKQIYLALNDILFFPLMETVVHPGETQLRFSYTVRQLYQPVHREETCLLDLLQVALTTESSILQQEAWYLVDQEDHRCREQAEDLIRWFPEDEETEGEQIASYLAEEFGIQTMYDNLHETKTLLIFLDYALTEQELGECLTFIGERLRDPAMQAEETILYFVAPWRFGNYMNRKKDADIKVLTAFDPKSDRRVAVLQVDGELAEPYREQLFEQWDQMELPEQYVKFN